MTKYKLEYIWLDGYTPVPNLRGKTQIKEFDAFPTLEQLPLWGFDGSSTMQAEGHSSDCMLKPVAVYPDGARTNGALVMCEVMMPDGGTPHPANGRATILDDPGAWFGFEQEYFFYKDGRPLGFPEAGYPAPQGPYYTGVGYKNVGDIARKMVEEHLDLCLYAGINHEGINAEVAKGQWEFQIFGKGSKKAADQMWIARYLLLRLTEKYGVDIEFHCKPLGDTDWNGSGMHCNFSTTFMRETGGKDYFEKLMTAFEVTARNISRFTAPTTTCASPASTKPPRSINSAMAWRTAARPSACPTASSRMITRAISRIAARTLRATPTRSLRRFEDDRLCPDRQQRLGRRLTPPSRRGLPTPRPSPGSSPAVPSAGDGPHPSKSLPGERPATDPNGVRPGSAKAGRKLGRR